MGLEMVRRDLIEKSYTIRNKIEKTLSNAGNRGLTLMEISRLTGVPPATVKRHLEKLVAIGRVDMELHRGSTIYRINGHLQYNDKVELSKDHILYIDAFVNPWGKPYIRIKERKRDPKTGKFIDMGAVIVDREKIDEFLRKIRKISENIEELL